MEKNEGKLDRNIRLIIGIVAIYAGWTYSAWWYLLAVIALFTSFTGFCALYKILGISTAKKVKSSKKKR